MSDRDVQGRFLPGHEGLPGAGRPKGSKQSLADQFIYDLAELWEREGKNILTQMAAEKPCELVRAVTRVLSSDEVRLRQDAVMVLDCKGMDNPDC
ncbi:MAG: hypothetical protein HOI67_04310 [Gammaproteobacteria bacterium]|jgi:hypothetical protein|nr:hypothetical protein [Gammaproteobacteria bacterium]